MYKNFTLTESEKEQILNMHKDKGYKQPINEQSVPKSIPFHESEIPSLQKRGFKFNSTNTKAVLNATHPSNIVTITKNNEGWVITKGGKMVFNGPHDHCDVQLDKLIGYNSLHGGYKKQ